MAQTKSASGAKKKTSAKAGKPVRREVGSVVCLALGLFTLIGYFVKDYWLIDWLCLYVFKGFFGWGFLIVPPCLLWAAYILAFHHNRPVAGRITAIAFIPLLFGAAVHLLSCGIDYGFDWLSIRSLYYGGMNLETGGVASGLLSVFLERAVSVYGALPVFIVALFSAVCVAGKISLRQKVEDIKSRPRPEYEPIPEPVPEKTPGKKEPNSPRRRTNELPASEIFTSPEPEQVPTLPPEEPTAGGIFQRRKRKAAIDIPIEDETLPEEPIPDMPQGIIYHGQPDREAVAECIRRGEEKRAKRHPLPKEEPLFEDAAPEEEPFIENAVPAEELTFEDGSAEIGMETVREPVPFVKPEKLRREDVEEAAEEIAQTIEDTEQAPEYQYPPMTLLHAGDGITSDGREEIALNRERLETTLHSFNIGASIVEVTRGPTVTRYDLELEAGVKLNKLTNLAGDLALSLGVVSVRIAPIPDKISTVGVEVPNKVVNTVYLRDIIDSPAFRNAASKLSFAIGKDIGGNCIVGNIAKLPHMLIAGTTGSGKSVCMNSLILSLLYKATPDEVRLIMIDPKMVELGIYNGIPHLYIPVVTDPKKAAGSLQWAVVEMMKRYRLFSEIGVRDLKGYNNYKTRTGEPTLPSVVIVIDELADLMMTAAKEVEESICRVAQMGRAAGVHLIIATQRPSADVITGLMKANIPSRIAFAVSSALESRIILDNTGAEKLIGMGDMLYAPLGCGKPLRVQGAFVSDEERERVINFIKQGTTPEYDDEILRQIEKAAAGKDAPKEENEDGGTAAFDDNPFSGCDELLPQAVDVILDTKQASVSMLQRRLKLGYSRAARLVDQMEELGIVGPFEGSKPRQLLITREQWQEMSMTGRTPMEKLIEEQKDDYSSEEVQP